MINNKVEPNLSIFLQAVDAQHCDLKQSRKHSKAGLSSIRTQACSSLADSAKHSYAKTSKSYMTETFSKNYLNSPAENVDLDDVSDEYLDVKKEPCVFKAPDSTKEEDECDSYLSYSYDGLNVAEIDKILNKSQASIESDNDAIHKEKRLEEEEIYEISTFGLISNEEMIRLRLKSNAKSENEHAETTDPHDSSKKYEYDNLKHKKQVKFFSYVKSSWKEDLISTQKQVSYLLNFTMYHALSLMSNQSQMMIPTEFSVFNYELADNRNFKDYEICAYENNNRKEDYFNSINSMFQPNTNNSRIYDDEGFNYNSKVDCKYEEMEFEDSGKFKCKKKKKPIANEYKGKYSNYNNYQNPNEFYKKNPKRKREVNKFNSVSDNQNLNYYGYLKN
jgi:hypothetical protein